MASFETLPASDRWSLAFYVVSLRHRGRDLARGERAFAGGARCRWRRRRRGWPGCRTRSSRPSCAALAPDARARGDRLAAQRAPASPRQPGGTFADARRLLGEVAARRRRSRARARAGRRRLPRRRRAARGVAARARPRARRRASRRRSCELRRTIDAGATIDADAVRRDVARAHHAARRRRGARARRQERAVLRGAGDRAARGLRDRAADRRRCWRSCARAATASRRRYVHLGWLLALPAGALTWFAVGAALGGARRELTEGVLTLVAAAMLLFVSHFVLGKLESRKWLKFLERKTTAVVDAGRWPLLDRRLRRRLSARRSRSCSSSARWRSTRRGARRRSRPARRGRRAARRARLRHAAARDGASIRGR